MPEEFDTFKFNKPVEYDKFDIFSWYSHRKPNSTNNKTEEKKDLD